MPAIYPVLQQNYALSFTQIGVLHFVFQVTASLLQPAVGLYTDRRPMFRLSTAGMGASLAGLLILAFAQAYWALLLAAACIGLGSAIFHPDSSRVARAASGGRYGLAQSVFQVGGNTGTALGPLLAAFVVLPLGQPAHRLVLGAGAPRDDPALERRHLGPRPAPEPQGRSLAPQPPPRRCRRGAPWRSSPSSRC